MTARPGRALLFALLLPPLALLAGACSAFQKKIEPQWVEDRVPTRSESVMFEVLVMSLQKAGYPVGVGADQSKREIVSGWFRSDAPFKGDGYRQRATVRYEPIDGETFHVTVRIQRETNESLRPLDPRYAEWEEAEDNVADAQRVLQYVRSFLSDGREFEVGPARSAGHR